MNHLVNRAGRYLPSLAKYIERCCVDLNKGRSVIAVLNNTVEADVVWNGCNAWLRDVKRIDVSTFDDRSLPLQFLIDALDVQWPDRHSSRTLETLLLKCELNEVISLEGLDHLPDASRQAWFSVFKRWADASQARRTSGLPPSSLWTVFTPRPRETLPTRDVWLSIYWWWSVPSALEVQMICRDKDEADDNNLGLEATWREALIPPLIGNDPRLIDVLWEAVLKDDLAILDQLLVFAIEQGWTRSMLEKLGLPSYAYRLKPNARCSVYDLTNAEREFWVHGLLAFTPEYGLQVSSAALALLDDREGLIHRYWHGQTSLLLPKIDEFRLRICGELTRRHNPTWPWRWQEPIDPIEKEAVRTNPSATGWGHLENLIRGCDDLQKERYRLRAISTAHYVRNQLAHHKPINFRDYCTLVPLLS